MDPRLYAKALVPIVASVLAAAYIGFTGGDVDSIQTIASEWEVLIGGVLMAALTYFIPNKA